MEISGSHWKTVTEFIYEKFRIFSIKKSTRINPRTGKPSDFLLMEGLDWVNVIPITADNQVVLVRQFRHGSDEFTIETPGGTVEPGEHPSATAVRELQEETGYVAADVTSLGWLYPNPAMQKMKIHFYVARDVKLQTAQVLDAGEDISVLTKPLAEMPAAILSGEINHALVVAAFGLLELHGGKAGAET